MSNSFIHTYDIYKRLCGYVKGDWGILRIHNIKRKIYRKMFPFFQRNHAPVCILTKRCRHFINNISNDQYALYNSMSRYLFLIIKLITMNNFIGYQLLTYINKNAALKDHCFQCCFK